MAMAMLIDGGPDVKTYLARVENDEIEWPRISPCCAEPLHGHGWYERGAGEVGGEFRIPIKRGCCSECGKTQAFLPAFLERSRIFSLNVVEEATERYAAGASLRAVARALFPEAMTAEPPYQRVWHWVCRLDAQVESVQAFIQTLLARLDPSGEALVQGVSATAVAAGRADRRGRLGGFLAWLARAAAALTRLQVWDAVPSRLVAAVHWLVHRTALATAEPTFHPT